MKTNEAAFVCYSIIVHGPNPLTAHYILNDFEHET